MKVLIIVTDRVTQRLLVHSLPKENFQVRIVTRDSIIETIQCEKPDILLTEHDDLCTHIRQHWPLLPMIVLLDSTQKQHISQALDSGADDCVVQPFGSAELQARMRAHVRRSRSKVVVNETTLDLSSKDGYIRMSTSSHKVSIGDQPINLSKIEFALLRELMTQEGKVLTHRHLLQRVWGTEYGEEHDYVRIYMNKLRGKIEPNSSKPLYLLTEVGVGYVFRSPIVATPRPDSLRFAAT